MPRNYVPIWNDDTRLAANLSRGIVVDPEDEWLLKERLWTIGNHGYAVSGRRDHTVLLHHAIIGQSIYQGDVTDHINRNRLDNRRSNLRTTTQRHNMRNLGNTRQVQIESTGRDGLFRARVYIGAFDTYEEAEMEGERLMKALRGTGYKLPYIL